MLAQIEAAPRLFQETAITWGLGVAVLLAVTLGLLWIIWKLGSRVTKSHEDYLASTSQATKDMAAELKAQTGELREIKLGLPMICQAKCATDDGVNFMPKPGAPRKRGA